MFRRIFALPFEPIVVRVVRDNDNRNRNNNNNNNNNGNGRHR
jgi:hypothetical protein